jgi:hypothetical protein
MTKSIHYIHCILAAFLFVLGCQHNSDYFEHLTSSYYYYSEGAYSKSILNNSNRSTNNIYGTIVEYKYNSNYITAKQMPRKEEYKSYIVHSLILEYESRSRHFSATSRAEVEQCADSIIDSTESYQNIFIRTINYWIIGIEMDTLYGPYDLKEFETVCRNLGVPRRLWLK